MKKQMFEITTNEKKKEKLLSEEKKGGRIGIDRQTGGNHGKPLSKALKKKGEKEPSFFG